MAESIDQTAATDSGCDSLACRLVGPEFAARKERITGELFVHADTIVALDDGYGFRFPGFAPWLANIVEFIELERECCPFFRFEIVVEPNDGPLWLHLRGADGVQAFIRDELGLGDDLPVSSPG